MGKDSGRFIDLPINTIGEEQIDLISRAIECDQIKPGSKAQSKSIAKIARKDRLQDAEHLAGMLEKCWPLHPVVACLLGPISRRRFGQTSEAFLASLTPLSRTVFRIIYDQPMKLISILQPNCGII